MSLSINGTDFPLMKFRVLCFFLLLLLGVGMFSAQADSARILAHHQQELALCNQKKNSACSAMVLRKIAKLYDDYLDFSKSGDYYQKAISAALQIDDKELLAALYGEYGRVFYKMLDFPKAFEYYQKAMDLCERTGNKQGKIDLLKKIGELYYHLGEFEKAFDHADQIIKLANEIGDKKNTGYAFSWKGNILMVMGKYKESLKQYQESIIMQKELNDDRRLAVDYANVAFEYQLLSDYETALKYHQKCYVLMKKNQDRYLEMLYLKDMGALIQNAPDKVLKSVGILPENRYKTSVDYEAKALQIAEELGDTPQKTYILEFLVSGYEKMGDFKEAYSLFQKLTKIKDEMTGQQIKAEIARKESQYFFEKKEAAEKMLNEKKQARLKLLYSIALSVFFIIAVAGFSLFYYTRMKKRKEMEIHEANRQIMQLEKEKMESELDQAKMEMAQFVSSLNEKNNLIDKISEELQQLNYFQDEKKNAIQETLIEIKHSVILTDEDWKKFLSRFEKIYPDFISILKTEYPKITAAESRYLMLVKIGFSSKEMADILGVSPNTVHVTWKRLREKFGFSRDESPQDILSRIKI
ncbi:tetratricopeptide repeat protein [Chryseobacterium koreense]|uniref:tetratricopeptide repeat protein n=1 Tax=Chryseobacterium koreense TaxID=232216 RepID=UPI0026F27FDC|nr:tetratricopeptide repeat protein [Chryseobacterium koreense]